MLDFKRITLENGLKVLIHEDHSTPLAAMTVVYDVGSKDENPEQTGTAHLFEHLMFSGSVNIPEYDTPLQLAGGENNAFTNSDITCYYLSIPEDNLETAFWLESDRMLGLDFSEGNLDIQKKVVIEEYKQRYLNQPYGDVMLLLKPLAYKDHPYRWPTIGKEISHIEKVSLGQIRDFFYSHYAPDNAVLCLAGNIDPEKIIHLSEKWFGPVPTRDIPSRQLPPEPEQIEERRMIVERNVPTDAIYKAWHISDRLNRDFSTLDLITDILAGGESGRLYTSLVRKRKLFSEINAYLSGDVDPGLLVIYGKPAEGVDMEKAERSVLETLAELADVPVRIKELEKVKNKFESSFILGNTSILNKAMNLAFYETIGDAGLVNSEVELYRSISPGDIIKSAREYLRPENCSTLFYKSKR